LGAGYPDANQIRAKLHNLDNATSSHDSTDD
jgi:hypothetical protein